MKGLELAKEFYQTYGETMLREQFPEWQDKIAVGLVGSGSECFGFDDVISQDHDFEPGFCLFLPDESVIDRRVAFQLERAYAKLPKTFSGFARQSLGPVGGNRHGVIRFSDFYLEKVGSPDGNLTTGQWLSLPSYALAEATNGEIFRDDSGEFSAIRKSLLEMPEEIRRKRIAGNLLLMAQSGQYNYNRCLSHGETGAAQLAAIEFVKSAMQVVFLLNRSYMPYYKWSFRALRALPKFSELADTLEFLLTTENTGELQETKYLVIEDVASMIISELQEQEMTKAICGDLEKHAYSVNDSIADADLRNLSIFAAV
ncbi:MAG: DUF4037 domain-containing protein [Ruminococcaceae bacterium]|nr:DUF4037 domain-containing protein [Oscillospiraceae bacterium]